MAGRYVVRRKGFSTLFRTERKRGFFGKKEGREQKRVEADDNYREAKKIGDKNI